MKLLLFASTPPPHHGQSYMVRLMLEGLGGDHRKGTAAAGPIQCYHVNPQLSSSLEDIGRIRPGKGFRLLWALLDALWCRFRYGVKVLYYIPGISLKGSIMRDVLLLPVLRPFFQKTVFHWHTTGMGEWIDSPGACTVLSRGARFALRHADLSITTTEFNLTDARKFKPRLALPVPNGIPDPCPDFDKNLLPKRREGQRFFTAVMNTKSTTPDHPARTVKVLFMALCTEDKGVLDALEAIHLLNTHNGADAPPLRFHLTIAGKFLNAIEEEKFRKKVQSLGAEKEVTYAGFTAGEDKKRLLEQNDLFCFPTYYTGESFPVVLIEAMAYGLPIVTSRWRSLPELFPPGYPGVVGIKRPDDVAQAVMAVLKLDCAAEFRRIFLENYTVQEHLRQLTTALLKVDPEQRG